MSTGINGLTADGAGSSGYIAGSSTNGSVGCICLMTLSTGG